MGERKVLNKYYPPDFDPAKVPRRKMPKDRQYKVRLMAPFNMRCTTCGEYIYKGKKFNAMKETVQGEDYLGIHIFRFHIRCTRCCGEITFRTDPRNTDYQCERGATRNFERWRVADVLGTTNLDEGVEEEVEENPMEVLEARTKESRQEMDILDALEEIKDSNARSAKVDLDAILKERLYKDVAELRKAREEDEAMIRKAFGGNIRRLDDDDGEEGGGEGGEGPHGEVEEEDELAALRRQQPVLADGADVTDVLVAKAPPRGKPGQRKRKAAETEDSGNGHGDGSGGDSLSIGLPKKKLALSALVRPKAKGAKSAAKPRPALVVKSKPKPAAGLGALTAYGSDSDSDDE